MVNLRDIVGNTEEEEEELEEEEEQEEEKNKNKKKKPAAQTCIVRRTKNPITAAGVS